MARCTSAAATAESTPPDSPQIAWPPPTCSRIRSICSSTMFSMVQDGRQPASSRNRLSRRVPCSVCITSGWNWTPNIRLAASSTAATGVAAVRAVTANPGGAAVQVSPCDIHTRWLAGVPARRFPPKGGPRGYGGEGSPPFAGRAWGGSSPSRRFNTALPYSAAPVRSTVPPRPATISWKP